MRRPSLELAVAFNHAVREIADLDQKDVLLTLVHVVDDPVSLGDYLVKHLDTKNVAPSVPRRALFYPGEQLR